MGLDMYLSVGRHVTNYEFESEENKRAYKAVLDVFGIKDIQTHSPSANVSVTVAYWRKANQIHKWFVDKVQDGVDECQESYVSREQLQELVAVCESVLADHSLAESVLPCAGGFFFGSTGYEDGYFQDLEETIEQIKSVLSNPAFKHWDLNYHSSW